MGLQTGEHAELFLSQEGRNKMISELEEMQTLFEQADDRLSQVAKPLRDKYDITDEKLKPFIDDYMSKLKRD
jgi:hypothetical protein